MRIRRAFGLMTVVSVIATIGASSVLPSSAAPGDARTTRNSRLKPAEFLRGHDAVGMAVKPGNTNHIVQTNADWVRATCEHGVSFDRGKTWDRGVLRAPEGFAITCDPLGHGPSSLDQYGVDFGSGNNVYATFGASNEGEGQSVVVARSTDGGRNFAQGEVALQGGPNRVNGPAYRFPKLLVDPQQGGDRLFVVAWDSGGSATDPLNPPYDTIVVARSDDGGATWSDPVVVSDPAVRSIEPSQLVLIDGALSVAYRTRGNVGEIVHARSENNGETWTRTPAAPVRGFQAGTTLFPASTFPRLAGDPNTGTLYIVYQQVPNEDGSYPGQADHFIGPDADILFIRSTDDGRTWTRPVVINELVPGELTQNRHPNIDVAPNGRVDIAWHDRRHSYGIKTCPNTHSPPAGTAPCTEARLGDTYYAFSNDRGATWSENRRITDRSINNDVGFDYRFGAYWDFGPVPLPLGNNEVLFGWMDSRQGDVQDDNLDIYFARLQHNATNAGVQQSIAKTNVKMAMRLSKLTYPGGEEAVLASTFATRPWSRVVLVQKKDAASALAAGVLARAYLGPVLLTNRNHLPNPTKAEVRRFSPRGAFLIGNLNPNLQSELVEAGMPPDDDSNANNFEVIGGGSAAEIAANVALELDQRTDQQKTDNAPAFDAVVIVNPDRADATTAAALAANRRLPILFSDQNSLPQATTDALNALDVDEALVVGGPASVGDAVMGQLPAAERLGSDSVSETTLAVARESIERIVPKNIVWVTPAGQPMAGALVGAAAGRYGGLQLVTPGGRITQAQQHAAALDLVGQIDRFIRVRTR